MKALSRVALAALLISTMVSAQALTVNSVTRLGPAGTTRDVLNYLVVFSEAVIGADATDFSALTTKPGVVVSGFDNNAADFRFAGGRPTRAFCSNLAGSLSNAVTVEFWLATDDTGGTMFDYAMSTSATDEIAVKHNGSAVTFTINGALLVTSTIDVTDQAWHHIACTWNGTSGDAKLYIDGVLNASGNGQAGHALATGGAVALGQHLSNASSPPGFTLGSNLYGRYDDLRIWNTVRTATQISVAMLRPRQGNEAGLVLNWSCDLAEDLGLGTPGVNDMRDTSPNGNHAQFGNLTTPQWVTGPTMDGTRYRVTLSVAGEQVCSGTVGLNVLNNGSIKKASDGVTALSAAYSAGETYSWVSPYTAMVLSGTSEDLALDPILVNGTASTCITAGNHLAIHLGSTVGTFNWNIPFMVMQAYPFGAYPGGSFSGVNVNFAATPAPVFVLDGTAALGPFGPILLPPGGIDLGGTMPAGLAGWSFIVQGAVLSPLAANTIYATTQAREMFVY